MTLGITLISLADVETAKSSAAREAWQTFPQLEDEAKREETFNDILVRWLIARGTCDPLDVGKPFDLWGGTPEDTVREALSFEGVKAVWNAIDRLAAEMSPVHAEIEDEELLELFAIAEESLGKMSAIQSRRVRRLLGACLDELREYAA